MHFCDSRCTIERSFLTRHRQLVWTFLLSHRLLEEAQSKIAAVDTLRIIGLQLCNSWRKQASGVEVQNKYSSRRQEPYAQNEKIGGYVMLYRIITR